MNTNLGRDKFLSHFHEETNLRIKANREIFFKKLVMKNTKPNKTKTNKTKHFIKQGVDSFLFISVIIMQINPFI